MSRSVCHDDAVRPEAARAQPTVAFSCMDCGHVFEKPSDVREAPCVRCGSRRTQVRRRRVSGALLAASASPDDGRFARVALWGALITSEQFAQCVNEQNALAGDGRDVRSLADLLIRHGYIRREQAHAVLRSMTTRTAEQWRNQFGQIALRRGYVTGDQLRECLEVQTKLVMSTGAAPFLGHLLIERGHMTEAHALAILKEQKRRHIGMLHELQRRLRTRRGAAWDLARGHPRVLWAGAFVLALAVAGALGAWVHSRATAVPTFALICDHCGRRAELPASAIARACPRCGKGHMCTPLRCRGCRVDFPLRIHASDAEPPWVEPCPVCGTLRDVTLPPGLEPGLGGWSVPAESAPASQPSVGGSGAGLPQAARIP